MLKRKENLKYEDFVVEYKINSYDKLLSFFQENDENPDLRENYIFRGVSDYSYELIPSALRKYEDGNYKINDYINNNDFNLLLNTKMEYQNEDGTKGKGLVSCGIDKNNVISNEIPDRTVFSLDEVQFKREISVLLHFLDYSDKVGLKIFADSSIRKWIHSYLAYENKFYETWPKEEFYEIISLAQHHGLPTRALDWSYDYKVSLYFAIEKVLKEEKKYEDCVLWAFNYKLFENNHIMESDIYEDFVIYRPKYNSNSNLKSQKGLFTFIVSKKYDNMDKEESFDKFIINKLINSVDESNKELYFKLDGFKKFKIPDNVKIFYKFIISGNIKAEILYNLYLDGYGTEEIYPNYDGVVDSIKNRVKLENILNQNK
ncbi:FRG domain-containing protein [uncultured Methanobrevibacter sp.]|uniref:FRG domain-containing protein n=1 Tax=uncultured Methanobrevibacter sp. TaxID=253161 RepID=UPI0025D94057|nr:FRG domain-containing protein [uncultured Methanobrevibacter sp.]